MSWIYVFYTVVCYIRLPRFLNCPTRLIVSTSPPLLVIPYKQIILDFSALIRVVLVKEMPRKPARRRRRQLLRPLPFSFSPFSRTVSQVASYCKVNHQIHVSKLDRKSPPNAAGNRFINHTLEEKSARSESSEEDSSEVVAQADFAFFDPKPDDFHGVKILLQTYLDNKQWDLSGFVDLILGNTTVGTVVKIEDDEDDGVFSLITALNLGRYKAMHFNSNHYLLARAFFLQQGREGAAIISLKHTLNLDHKCIMELKEFLLKVGPEEDVKDSLRLLLGEEAHNVGLSVSQCVVNLPPQLLPPLCDALFDEVSWATEDEPTVELRSSFSFKIYLLISRIYKLRNYQLMWLVMAIEADKASTFWKELHTLLDEPRGHEKV
ncbi:Protein BCCIP-like [Vitis vinifera]|uniref:Protein BCCIP-like n=1 Tax=Vitis vinifera TaxID=29760 RepID=A0A438JUE4_VITVI|nr:Protein BCCIP-like [Vitis vinifera]